MTVTLYVKTHNKTGLKYFGKTTRTDPEKYRGSGKYWTQHIKVHGYDVTTEIIGTFDDVNECSTFAVKFSTEHDIINSPEWANLIKENGLDGAPKGHVGYKFTDEQLHALSQMARERWEDPGYREKLIQAHKQRWTNELRTKQSNRLRDEFWTSERRLEHAKKLAGRPGKGGGKGVKKRDGHGNKVSAATRGVPKSEAHRQALSGPKPRVCRLTDRKEMSVNHFTRWIKSLLAQKESI